MIFLQKTIVLNGQAIDLEVWTSLLIGQAIVGVN